MFTIYRFTMFIRGLSPLSRSFPHLTDLGCSYRPETELFECLPSRRISMSLDENWRTYPLTP